MGFRTAWLEHDDLLSVHTEDFIYAVERAVPNKPVQMLLVGVGNGGSVQIWRKILPEGSVVTAIDNNPKVSGVDLDIHVVDFDDDTAIKSVLKGRWFDVVIDATGTFSPQVWPFLRPQGVLITTHYDHEKMIDLVRGMESDTDFWLPNEEIMSLTIFPNVSVVEKRNPRVVPYLNVITGTKDPVVSENFYRSIGAKRITPTSEPTGKRPGMAK